MSSFGYRRFQILALLGFFGACGAVVLALIGGTGTRLPLLNGREYTVTAVMSNVDNLVQASQVQTAGVQVGQVRSIQRNAAGSLDVVIGVDSGFRTLHDGASVRLGSRSLVGESYLDLTDGGGAALPSGSVLPVSAVHDSVQLTDVLKSLDAPTRDHLQGLLRQVGASTSGTHGDLDALLAGLGKLGRQGHTALDAVAAQSQDLQSLTNQTAQLLQALDTGQGQIADLVSNANRVTAATAGQKPAIEASLKELPATLDAAKSAGGSLVTLAGALAPVASDLRAAAPGLSTALQELPATTSDLRGMLAPISGVLGQAPATLQRIPTLAGDVQAAIPAATSLLSNADPMLAYLSPYGPELAAYFANFNAVLNYRDEAGAYFLRLTPLVNTHSPQLPVSTDNLLGNYTNPYPAPGTGSRPGPFTGAYPRVQGMAR